MSKVSDQPLSTAQAPDPKVLEILVCPVTKTRLRYNPDTKELISSAAGLAFPVRDGVPVLIVNSARALNGDGT